MTVIAFPQGDTPVAVAPLKITAYQAEVVLDEAGLLESVEALVNHPDTPSRIKIAWRNRLDIERSNPMVALIILQLGVSEEYIDQLFARAKLVRPGAL